MVLRPDACNLDSTDELGSTHLTLYILLGTCDLTEKNGSYIKLHLNSNDGVLNICAKYSGKCYS